MKRKRKKFISGLLAFMLVFGSVAMSFVNTASGAFDLSGNVLELPYDYFDNTDPAKRAADPVEMYRFNGSEEVIDLVYSPEMTSFLKRAADAGCKYQNGYDMLIRQACYQYACFTGKDFPEHLMARVQFGKT